MPQPVLVDIDGAVGRITLNQPEVRNAITIELAVALERALWELAPRVGVIVIRGAGGNFSVGGDFKELERLRAQGAEAMRELFESFAGACGAIAELPVPVVAAVEGYAMAGGFELMMACDIALVREDATLADNHTNFGQVPGGGSSQRLPRLAGRPRALGLILTGDRLSGADAAAWGLAYRALPAEGFEAGVEEVVARLASKDREALRRCKRLVYDGLRAGLDDGLAMELETVLEHLQSDGAAAGIDRFRERAVSESLIGSGPVLLDLDGALARLRLNRPEASNGLDVPLLRALYDALMRCHGEPRVRALVLSGEGPHFCAGGDVKTFASKGEALPDYLREATSWLQICASALMRLQAPVVTLVHGFAAGGGGFGLVCASDLVLAAESSRFLLGATRVGMAPDAGSTVTLQRIVGARRAMEIALTNPTLTARQALEIGLVTRVVADDVLLDEGLGLARSLAAGPTRALAETKRLMWEGIGRSVEECLPDESRTVSMLSGTEDAREGLAAVIERRAPEFRGR